ncbi:SpoVG family protein [candidate division KSB1 bacterium]
MEITEVNINIRDEERLKAFANITFDDVFVVRGLKIIKGDSGLFVCMPSKKMNDGSYRDIAHPIRNEFRIKMEQKILTAYKDELSQDTPEN